MPNLLRKQAFFVLVISLLIQLSFAADQGKKDLQNNQKPQITDEQRLAYVIRGILTYTEWKTTSMPRLCVLGRPTLVKAFNSIVISNEFTAEDIKEFDSQALDFCNAVYFGQIDKEKKALILEKIAYKNILSIGENAVYCDDGTHFCFDPRVVEETGFELNLDALALSGLRVNPQVLRVIQQLPERP